MSILTVAQIKTEIRAIFGGRTDLDTRLTPILDLAQQRLARLHDFDELRAIATINTAVTGSAAADKVISVASLVPASGRFRKIYSVRLFSATKRSRKLDRVMPKNWDRDIPEPEFYSRGAPTHYTFWGKDQLELWRVPDAVYALWFRYSRWPTLIASDAVQLDLENVDDVIIYLAGSYVAMSIGNHDKSNELFKIYAALAKETLMENEEDFDTFQRANSERVLSITRGFNDPFVRSIDTVQD